GSPALADNLRRTRAALEGLGVTVRGHRSPQSDWDVRVLDALTEAGYAWNAENGPEPHPYRIRVRNGKTLWRFPVAGDDWQYEAARVSPREMLDGWRAQVRDARGARTHLALGFHPWVEAAPARWVVLDAYFHWLTEQDVEVKPFGDVLDLMELPTAPELAAAHG